MGICKIAGGALRVGISSVSGGVLQAGICNSAGVFLQVGISKVHGRVLHLHSTVHSSYPKCFLKTIEID